MINKTLYSIVFIFALASSANALTVSEILGADMARLMRDGKTDLEIQLIAKIYYKSLRDQGKTDEEIKALSDTTYECFRAYKNRMRNILPQAPSPNARIK